MAAKMERKGANGLRGGIRTYSNETLLGDRAEKLCAKESFYVRGDTLPGFQTEARKQQRDILTVWKKKNAQVPNFLANPQASSVSLVLNMKKPPDWKTTSRVDLAADSIEWNDINMNRHSNFSTLVIDENEEPATPDRFESELQRATKFGAALVNHVQVNPLPNTPPPLIKFRANIVTAYGQHAISYLRYQLQQIVVNNNNNNKSLTTSMQLTKLLKSLHKETSNAEIAQIVAFFTSCVYIDIENMLRVLIGRVEGFNEVNVRQLFKQLVRQQQQQQQQQESRGGQGLLLLEECVRLFEESFGFVQETLSVETITSILTTYTTTSTTTTRSEGREMNENGFVRWHWDMFASSPQQYTQRLQQFSQQQQ